MNLLPTSHLAVRVSSGPLTVGADTAQPVLAGVCFCIHALSRYLFGLLPPRLLTTTIAIAIITVTTTTTTLSRPHRATAARATTHRASPGSRFHVLRD